MADLFTTIWQMLTECGFTVNDIYISLKDIMVFSVLGSLFIYLIVQLLGGND